MAENAETTQTLDIWNHYTEQEKNELEELCKGYRTFLSNCKTERESADEAVRQAKAAGYVDLAEIISAKRPLKAGDKVYAVCMKKAVALFHIGTKPLAD